MNFTITFEDFANDFSNQRNCVNPSLKFMALGFAVSLAVNKIAHKIFDLKEGTSNSYAMKTLAFFAGSVVCFTFDPVEVTLVAFTKEKTLEMLILNITITFIAKIITGKTMILPFGSGMMMDSFGTSILALSGIPGAIVGAIL